MKPFSIIVPTFREAAEIEAHLRTLQTLRSQAEILVVDGGSDDGTAKLARPWADRVMTASRGRGGQLNAGARAAQGEVLLFLHADTRLPDGALNEIHRALADNHRWGRFDVALDGHAPLLWLVAVMMNLRSRLTGIATGDQAIFVTQEAFGRVGGFPVQPLMEDIELCRRLKNLGSPACLKAKVVTSARRWESAGVIRTILLMWWLRLRYFLGADPNRLAWLYRAGRFG
ncbi:MAG: TIGR04283 family arsenosugar biosynthesis glycosyltransferase [Methylohalobius sp. ZOD2]